MGRKTHQRKPKKLTQDEIKKLLEQGARDLHEAQMRTEHLEEPTSQEYGYEGDQQNSLHMMAEALKKIK